MPDRPLREAVALAMGWREQVILQKNVTDWPTHSRWTAPSWHDDGGDKRYYPPDYPAADYSGVPAMEAWLSARDRTAEHEFGSGGLHYVRVIQKGAGWRQGIHYAEALARAIVAATDA